MSVAAAESAEEGPVGFVGRAQALFSLGGEWWARWCGWILLIVAPFIAYSNSFEVPFVFDGNNYVREKAWIGGVWKGDDAAIKEFRKEAQTRLLPYLTFAIDYKISLWATRARTEPHGHSVPVYHATSLLIHIVAGLALYGIARRAFRARRFRGRFHDYSERFALVVALMWVVHPLDTQSVTYLYQRIEAMMGMFYFLTLYFFTRFAERGWFRWGWAAASILSCLAGMVSKEAMATAPLVVLWYDYVFVRRSDRRWAAGFLRCARHGIPRVFGFRRLVAWLVKTPTFELLRRRGLCHFAHFATLAVLYVLMKATPYSDAGIADTSRVSPQEYALTQFGVVRHYMKLAVYPVELNIDYAWEKVVDWPMSKEYPYISFASAKAVNGDWKPVIFPAIFVLGLVLLTFIAMYCAPAIGFLAGTFFVILAPTSTIVPIVDYCFEHRMYVPLAPLLALLFVLGDAGFNLIAARFGRRGDGSLVAKTIIVALIASAFIVLTYRRNHDYRSRVALWEDAAQKAPQNDRAQYNFGVYLQTEGTAADVDREIARYRGARKTNPNAEQKVESTDESMNLAVQQYLKALALNKSQNDGSHLNLGNIFRFQAGRLPAGSPERREKFRDAELHFLGLLEIQPAHSEGRLHLADVYLELGSLQTALEHLDRLIRDEPENAAAKTLRERALLLIEQESANASPAPTAPSSAAPTPTLPDAT
jgi:hypothetical protein